MKTTENLNGDTAAIGGDSNWLTLGHAAGMITVTLSCSMLLLVMIKRY